MAMTPEYLVYLKTPKWKVKRLRVLTRANFTCEQCKKDTATQVHHKTYKRIYREKLGDLMAVCAKCHREIHGIKEKPKEISVPMYDRIKSPFKVSAKMLKRFYEN